MANIINGTAGADALNGLSGDNVISGGGGSDKLNGGAGLDTLDGGSGSDTVSGNSGDDMLIFRMSENVGSSDVYDGGSGKDVLQLNLTLAQWNSAAVQTDLAKYLTFLAFNTNVHTEEATNATFQFSAFGLAASKIEFLQVVVDGASLSAEDNPVTLVADSMGAGENTAGAGGNILANDVVLDQVATFTFTQAAHGAVSTVADLSVVNAPVATPTYTPTAGFWDYLAVGETGHDSFTYTVTDADGDTATTTVSVNIAGANDPVTITSGAQAGGVSEDAATLKATGTVAFSDVDLSDGHTASFAAAAANATHLGTFALGSVSEAANAATGSVGWTYTLDNTAAQYLAQGQSVTETYVVTVDDGHGSTATQNVVVTITGTNDAPTITAQDLIGGVTEQGTPAGDLSDHGVISFADVDLTDVHLVSAAGTPVGSVLGALSAVKDHDTTSTGTGGQLTWTYTVADSAVEYLAKDQTKVESFTITLDDGNGGLITKQIDVTITGTNDAPTITSAAQAGAVVEDAPTTPSPTDSLNAAGTVAFSDVDLSDGHTASFAAAANATHLGTFAVGAVSEAANAATGSVGWTYTLDNSAAQYLAQGQTVTETYVVTVDDGHGSTATQNVDVTITGTNDAVSITSPAQAGAVTEDAAVQTATGTVAFTDPDLIDTHTASVTSAPPAAAAYGSFALAPVSEDAATAPGSVGWTYTLDNAKAQSLAEGQTVTETYTVQVADTHGSTTTQDVVVTITGTNDIVSITSPAQAGAVTEDAAVQTATGTVAFTDPDLIDTHTASVTSAPPAAAYGSFALAPVSEDAATAPGSVGWTYTLDNAKAQSLAEGQTVTETYTVQVADTHGSTTTQDVVVTITGTNDIVSITSGAQAGAVVEDAATTDSLNAAGTVAFSDVDLSDGHTASFAAAAANATHLGTFALGSVSEAANAATGSLGWTYTLDNAASQYLAQGQTVTETYVVTVDDGHGSTVTQNVDVTITGTNDAPTITAQDLVGGVTEQATPAGDLSDHGVISFADVDLSDAHSVSVTPVGSPLGTLSAVKDTDTTGAGTGGQLTWTYTVADSAVEYLAKDQTKVESFTVSLDDGNGGLITRTVDVTITGANDAPTITSSAQAGAVVEDAPTTPSPTDSLSAAGTVAFSDVDLSDGHTASFAAAAANATHLGTFAVGAVSEAANAATGSVGWTYTLDNSAAQYLAQGQTVTETYVVTVDDGNGATATQNVDVTITGTNDAPVISLVGTDSASAGLTETDAGLATDGHVTVTDVDLTDVDTLSVAGVSIDAASTGSTSLGATALKAMMSVDQTGAWHFNSGSEAFNSLGAGQTLVLNYVLKADDGLANDTQTVAVTITGTNDAPVAAVLADHNSDEDTAFSFTAPASTDVDSAGLNYTATLGDGAALPSWLHFDATTRTFSGTPPQDFNGVVAVKMITSDGSLTDASTFNLTINPVNDAPVAVADTLAATEDTPVTYTATQLLGNDTDVDNPNSDLHISSVTSGSGGTAALNGDGSVTFTPNANFNGVADFSYTASDGSLDSAPATVTVNVAAVNDAPVSVADTLSATEDTPVTYTATQLLGNDTDVDSPTLHISSVTNGTGGTAALNADGSVTFTPNANFNGAADFSYKASDGSLDSAPATVTVNVAAVNDAPVAVADTLSATEDTPVTYTANQLLGNDSDVDSPTLHISSVTSGTGGTAVLNGDGTVTFTPNANFNGAADFSYKASDGALDSAPATVTVNVAAVNDPPVFTSGATGSIAENSPISTVVYDANVTDLDGAPAVFSLTGTDSGLFNVNASTGEVTFKVSPNFETPSDAGADNVYNFSVNAFDGTDTTVQAVAVTVTNVNEAPAIDSDGAGATATKSVPENTTAVTTVHATDPDAGTTLGYSIVGGADQAKFAINPATGALSFVAAPDFEAPTDADHNNSYIVQVRASDGALSDDQTLTVNVTDVVETPPDTQGPTSIGFTLATAGATTETGGVLVAADAIGTFVAQGDPNSATFHYALSGADASKFALNTTTGVLSVGGSDIAAQATPYAITISALDQANNAVAEDIKVWVGGSGDQTLIGVGANIDFQYGLNGNDTLNGGAGDDALVGGQNTDVLIGGSGADQLSGGGASDSFRFTSLGDAGDKILDFQATGGQADVVQLSVPGFSLQNQAGAGASTMIDVAALGAGSIAGADVVRWTGAATSMDSSAEINSMLAGKTAPFSGGVFVLAYDPSGKAALWYDDSASNGASTVTEITTFDNLTSTSTFTSADFVFI